MPLAALAAALALTTLPVVLRDGSVVRAVRPPRIEGRLAVIELADGSVVSVPVARIDREASAERERREAEAARASEREPASPEAGARTPGMVGVSRSLTSSPMAPASCSRSWAASDSASGRSTVSV